MELWEEKELLKDFLDRVKKRPQNALQKGKIEYFPPLGESSRKFLRNNSKEGAQRASMSFHLGQTCLNTDIFFKSFILHRAYLRKGRGKNSWYWSITFIISPAGNELRVDEREFLQVALKTTFQEGRIYTNERLSLCLDYPLEGNHGDDQSGLTFRSHNKGLFLQIGKLIAKAGEPIQISA